MIVHPARHLFEAKYPTLGPKEKEVLYQHPTEDIKCNQLGVLYCDEKVYGIYNKADSSMVRNQKTRTTCGTKPKVIWECYTGETVHSPHFFYANANPLDLRFENLIHSKPLSAKERAPYIKIKAQFVKASVEHLIKIEDRMEKVGIPISDLHSILMIPHWLVAARAKVKKALVERQKLLGGKSRTTPEEADEIESLYLRGMSVYAIINRFGWKSSYRVKKVVRERGLVR